MNPWDNVADRYIIDSIVTGTVRTFTNYGAFIELEEGVQGLLHVEDISWTRRIYHPSEALEIGQHVQCKVLSVEPQQRRITLGIKQFEEDPWLHTIPSRFQSGQIVKCKVTRITNFGAFVELEDGLPGLLHISELTDYNVGHPGDVVSIGQEIDVKILRVDTNERKIGVSRKRAK